MESKIVFNELERNISVFKSLLEKIPEEQYRWKPSPDKWNLLEIVCHLHDEELEDFRARVKHVLETPSEKMPGINPVELVSLRKYAEQDYETTLDAFLTDRKNSVEWLRSLKNPTWNNFYTHAKLGNLYAGMFLNNWLAHDLLHIRQITRLKFDYFRFKTGESFDYAGNW
ncbi:MAG: DinB family protein [Bacteroidia bacterium]|nr:DinB family protein [Bacteroidia bacterium]